METESSGAPGRPLLFAVIVGLYCLWILSLPVFPTQDGPMHRYYVHVLGKLLGHQSGYGMYAIRHPVPPYLTHYAALLALSRVVPYDWAEKLLTCGIVLAFAYGFRFCATALGRLGGPASLCLAPLLLPWALMMGFFNYTLGVALLLWAAGAWARAAAGKPRWWAVYAAFTVVLTFTHPVPLLILICLGLVDILLGLVRAPMIEAPSAIHRIAARAGAAGFASLALLFVLANAGKGPPAAPPDIGFHPHFLSTAALLTGVSPYYTRSVSPLINGYRLSLYLLLGASLVLGARRFRAAWQARALGLGDSFFAAAVVLALVLPFAPDYVNNSGYFATRMVVLVWVGALAAASAYVPRRPAAARIIVSAALASAVVSLLTAEVYIRPVAREVSRVEQQALPEGRNGLLLLGPALDEQTRRKTELAPDDFTWAGVLPFLPHEDVALDSPWIDQTITPVAPVPGSPLLVDDIRLTAFSKINGPSAPGRSLPARKEKAIVAASDFIIYAGAPGDLASGLSSQLDRQEASEFRCSAHGWYLVCVRKSAS